MSRSTHAVLVAIVDRYEESGEPVSKRALDTSLDVSEQDLSESLESLREFDLLAVRDDGYRPTVTAHGLLALDVDFDDALVLDVVED